MALKITDKAAHGPLYDYACSHEGIDPVFSGDLRLALWSAGFKPAAYPTSHNRGAGERVVVSISGADEKVVSNTGGFTAGRFKAVCFLGAQNGRSTWIVAHKRNGSGEEMSKVLVDYDDLPDLLHVLTRAITAHGKE